ncbi:MAG TPA: TonB-dependent receptor [Kiritimatiellia bacterium]|nr:TonB-dependent receptor [Kiritimatiellia bacterium]
MKSSIRKGQSWAVVIVWVGLWGIMSQALWGQEMEKRGGGGTLADLSLEALLSLQIVSASQTPDAYFDTPAPVAVVTGDDIRRSGATTLADALALAPGMTVSRIDLSRWAVSVRGFHTQFAKNLLVLIDGRSVYTPLFSGTTWELQDVLLEDVDRIEVIRGPGGLVWGANAVNGVINVITKSSRDTQGGQVVAGGGTTERVFGSVRYGGELNETTTYRVYGKGFLRDGFVDSEGNSTLEEWHSYRTGFRLDGEPSLWDKWSLHGGFYYSYSEIAGRATVGPRLADEVTLSTADNYGAHVIGNWSHVINEGSRLELKGYYDWVDRDVSPTYKEQRHTVDAEVKHVFELGLRNQVAWGGGYRFMQENNQSGQFIGFDPENRDMHLVNLFVEDTLSLLDERLLISGGSKFEHNDFTGWEVQPSLRLTGKVAEEHRVWGSVARAVRIPSRLEREGNFLVTVDRRGEFPVAWYVFGDRDLDAEELIAYEAGYRGLVTPNLMVDVSVFYHDYDKLASAEPGERRATNPEGTAFLQPFNGANLLKGESYGVESSVQWSATDWLRLQAIHSFLRFNLKNKPGGQDFLVLSDQDKSPRHQFGLRTSMDLGRDVELDLWGRYVDPITRLDVSSYFTLDARVAWRYRPNVEFAVVGQNLLESRHKEYSARFLNTLEPEIERGVYGKVTWLF